MARPEDIPTDLALEVGANLDPRRFLDVARHFFGYVEEIAKQASNTPTSAWEVIARQGSTILAMRPADHFDILSLSDLYERLEAASAYLIKGEVSEGDLPEKALSHVQMLAELTDRRGSSIPIRLWVRRNPSLMGPEVGQYIRESRGSEYHDFGSLDGRLQTIQDSGGRLEFRIKDILYRNPIKCIVSEDMLSVVMENFRRRVEVFGDIRYSQKGVPLAITVRSLEPVPSDDELPTAENVRGILGGSSEVAW